jgi:survival-of-motor-neuron-related-splicing factor 30
MPRLLRRGDQKEGDLSQKPAKKGRKLEQKKVLEAGQKKWQDFAAKGVRGKLGKSKKIGEASMFRTPESVHGRGTSTFFIWPFMSYG